jgi:hypothetical protein
MHERERLPEDRTALGVGDHRRIPVLRELHHVLKAAGSRDQHARASPKRICGGDPGFVGVLDVFVARLHSRRDALAPGSEYFLWRRRRSGHSEI